MTPIARPIEELAGAAASARREADDVPQRVIDPHVPDAAPAGKQAGYEPPRVEPLGHWQVHTMDTYSIDILP
jgi:hypothetical protein